MENLELKSLITKMKNLLKGLNSRFELTEERLNECEGRAVEIYNPKIREQIE